MSAVLKNSFYAASRIKRKRATKLEMAARHMRRAGTIPFHWISDNTRWMRKANAFDGIEGALQHTARTYRRAVWADAPVYVEIWIEKDALAGVVVDVASEFDVPLMVARGYSSVTFLYSAAEALATKNKPCFIYHLGDFDPSGVDAAHTIESALREFAPSAEIHFQRIAATPEQIVKLDLPSRETKRSDSRSKKWGSARSVELDAIPPNALRALVRFYIEQHLPYGWMKSIQAAEESERSILKALASELAGDSE